MKGSYPSFVIVDRRATIARFARGWHRKPTPYGKYIVPADLAWEPQTFEELVSTCRLVCAADAIHLLAGFSLMLEGGGQEEPDCQRNLAEQFFCDADYRKVKAFATQDGGYSWVSPLQFRLLISMLIQHGSNEGTKSLADPDTRFLFGKALVSSSVVLTAKLPPYDPTGPIRGLQLELEGSHRGFRGDQRGIEQISVKGFILAKILKDTGIADVLTRELGFSPTEFQTALTALWSHYNSLKMQHLLQAGSLSIDFEYMMGQARIPKVVGDEMLRLFCTDLGALPPFETSSKLANVAYLAERPFGIYQGLLICLDLEFALARMGRELWNLASRIAKDRHVSEFAADAGYAFEDYCELHLAKIVEIRNPIGARLVEQKLLEGAALDFLYIEGETALAIECKTAPLPTSALFGTDPDILAQAIRDKFVTGTKKNKQGFIQCANHIRTMLKRPEHFGLNDVTQIIPCLVVLEDVLTYAPAYDFTVHEAAPLFAEFGSRVGTPVIIHSEDLAHIAMRSRGVSPCAVLRKLGAASIFKYATTRKFILSEWDERFLMKYGEVELERPLHFVDDAIAYLEQEYSPAPSVRCETCSFDMVLTRRSDGPEAWWCKQCNKPSHHQVTQSDIVAADTHREQIVASYRASRASSRTCGTTSQSCVCGTD